MSALRPSSASLESIATISDKNMICAPKIGQESTGSKPATMYAGRHAVRVCSEARLDGRGMCLDQPGMRSGKRRKSLISKGVETG
jgi:hypothetical protein